VTEGAILTANNQDEFAGVIAHEMGHQLGGHFCPQRQASGTLSTGHSRESVSAQLGSLRQGMDPAKEREADELAARILLDAGYDPSARSRVISRASGSSIVDRRPPTLAAQRREPRQPAAVAARPRPGGASP